ncbi:MAG TPA: helix-turn-helix domain-containing protein [Ilumatobacteraceae bacterium]|nr:helix-turn-helix domain-containing protein [Ilumatobacteraceae bacterium]
MSTPPDPGTVKAHIDATRPLLVTVAMAAEILSMSRSSIYQLIWNDELIPIRIGRSVRFPLSQLEQFVADRIDGSRLDNSLRHHFDPRLRHEA